MKIPSPGTPTHYFDFYGKPIHCGDILMYVSSYMNHSHMLKVLFVDDDWAADRMDGSPDSWLDGSEDWLMIVQKYDGGAK